MDFVRVLVNKEVTKVQRRCVNVQLCQIGAGTSQNRFDSSRYFAQRKGLHDVVVGTKFQPGNSLRFKSPSGQEDHRHITDEPQFAQDVAAIFNSKDNVQQDQI